MFRNQRSAANCATSRTSWESPFSITGRGRFASPASGRVFLEEARAALQRAELAVDTVRAVAGGKRGKINVGYASSPSLHLLPPTLRYFHETDPEVTVQLHDFSGSKMVRCLLSGELDLALAVWGSSFARAGLAFEELLRIPLAVALPAQHRLVKVSKLNSKQLLAEPLITYTRADYPDYHERIAQWFAPLTRQPNIVEEHDSIGALLAAVAAGRGVALVAQTLNESSTRTLHFVRCFRRRRRSGLASSTSKRRRRR